MNGFSSISWRIFNAFGKRFSSNYPDVLVPLF
jgi:hypothetical protein